jgi:hypothetical protein
MFETLIGQGADMNVQDSNGNNILHVLVSDKVVQPVYFSLDSSNYTIFRFIVIILVLTASLKKHGSRNIV